MSRWNHSLYLSNSMILPMGADSKVYLGSSETLSILRRLNIHSNMPLWSRIADGFRRDRLNREIEEELQLHIAEAIAEGRDPGEARRAFGSALPHR